MTQEEYEVEKAQIELSYDEKVMQFQNELREIDTRNSDLSMQRAENEKDAAHIRSLLDTVRHELKKELLDLKRKKMIAQKQSN